MTKYYTPKIKFHLKSNGDLVVEGKSTDRITCGIDFNNVNTGIGSKCPSEMLHISGGDVGLDCKNPSEKLEVTQEEFSEVEKHSYEKVFGHPQPGCPGCPDRNSKAVIDKTAEFFNKTWVRDKKARALEFEMNIENEVDKAKFTEELKALHYDLDRAKNMEAREKLVEEFSTNEFKRLYFHQVRKNKQLDFFIKTWDLF